MLARVWAVVRIYLAVRGVWGLLAIIGAGVVAMVSMATLVYAWGIAWEVGRWWLRSAL